MYGLLIVTPIGLMISGCVSSVILDIYQKNKVLKLDKQFQVYSKKPISVQEIEEIVSRQKKLSIEEMHEVIKKYTKDELKIFSNVLVKNFPQDYLSNFFDNLNCLHLYKYKFILPLFGALGVNIPFIIDGSPHVLVMIPNSLIQLIVNNKTTPWHELFHFASMIKTKDGCGCGFKRGNLKKNFVLGTALNEGYTQLMTERYFSNNIETVGESFSYRFCERIAKNIEIIIEKSKMEKLYLMADLRGLINELALYDEAENIVDFLKAFDNLKEMIESNIIGDITENPIITDRLLFVQKYLIKIYIIQQVIEYNNSNIDYEHFLENVKSYFLNLKNDLIIPCFEIGIDLCLFDEEMIETMIHNEMLKRNINIY